MGKRLATLLVAVWIVQKFAYFNDFMSFLNGLPPAEAEGAKVMAFGGHEEASKYSYFLIFKTEHPEIYTGHDNAPVHKNIGD